MNSSCMISIAQHAGLSFLQTLSGKERKNGNLVPDCYSAQLNFKLQSMLHIFKFTAKLI